MPLFESMSVVQLGTHTFCKHFPKDLQIIMAVTIRGHILILNQFLCNQKALKIFPNEQTKEKEPFLHVKLSDIYAFQTKSEIQLETTHLIISVFL